MKRFFSIHWVLVAALWYFFNGLLHDIFVLIDHQGSYNRELLRLLTDGHILMLSGAVVFVCYLMMLSKIQCGGLIGIIVSGFMLVYCAMIFPFLKSVVTIGISLLLLAVSMRVMNGFPNIYNIMKEYRD